MCDVVSEVSFLFSKGTSHCILTQEENQGVGCGTGSLAKEVYLLIILRHKVNKLLRSGDAVAAHLK